MLLDVAVEEGQARLIGGEVDDGSPVVGNDDCVLDDAGSLLPVDFGEFPEMAVKVHGVGVIGAIAHDEPVPRALLEHEFAFVGIGLTVYQKRVEFACATGDLLEDHLDGLLRGG